MIFHCIFLIVSSWAAWEVDVLAGSTSLARCCSCAVVCHEGLFCAVFQWVVGVEFVRMPRILDLAEMLCKSLLGIAD